MKGNKLKKSELYTFIQVHIISVPFNEFCRSKHMLINNSIV